jgi:hypothetical protein
MNGIIKDQLIGVDTTYLVELNFTMRVMTTGLPAFEIPDPYYVIDYAFQRPILVFQSPTTESQTNFKNILYKVNMNS